MDRTGRTRTKKADSAMQIGGARLMEREALRHLCAAVDKLAEQMESLMED